MHIVFLYESIRICVIMNLKKTVHIQKKIAFCSCDLIYFQHLSAKVMIALI